MKGIFPFIGYNAAFWLCVGLVRFLFEPVPAHVERKGGITPAGGARAASVAVASITAFLLALLALPFAAEFLIFGFLPVFCGYVATRIERQWHLATAMIAGSAYWLFIAVSAPFFGEIFVRGDMSPRLLISYAAVILCTISGGMIAKVSLLGTKAKYFSPLWDGVPLIKEDVAALIPAHNEEGTIENTIKSLERLYPRSSIFVASDGSTDRTLAIARERGVSTLDIQPNGGKAQAIKRALDEFDLLHRFRAVQIVDADTEPNVRFLDAALPYFRDPEVAAFAAYTRPYWYPHLRPRASMFFSAYRVRLYLILHLAFRYGQTSKFINVLPIIPGFASVYRTSVLEKIDISRPGLVQEDFNMTFEVHHKKLGRIAYHQDAFAVCHEPQTLGDYYRQVRRWNLGFWQTVRAHGIWPSLFWTALGAFLLEMFIYSLMLLVFPAVLIYLLLAPGESIIVPIAGGLTLQFTLLGVLLGFFALDYLLTVLAAMIEKKPVLLLYGVGFFLTRYIESFLFLYTLPLAFTTSSAGTWKSPRRPGSET